MSREIILYAALGVTITTAAIIIILYIRCKNKDNYSSTSSQDQTDVRSLNDISQDVNKLFPSEANYGGTGDKGHWHHDYLDYYEKILNQLPTNFKLLEIGVAGGYSIISFARKYNQASIYGIDVDINHWNQNKDKFNITQNEINRLNVQELDATHDDIIHKVPNNLDVILDDGSHQPEQMIKAFNLLFPNNLKKGGIYIIEDVHCDSEAFPPFIDYVKELLPFVYKFSNFKECKMLKGRDEIKKRIALDWRNSIKDITFSRDVIVITKEINC